MLILLVYTKMSLSFGKLIDEKLFYDTITHINKL